jgi:glycerol-3-phosphate dehydrogenase
MINFIFKGVKRDHGEEAIFSLFLTTNFLDIPKITFLCGTSIAKQIEGCKPAEIMEKYNLEKKSENNENNSKYNEQK